MKRSQRRAKFKLPKIIINLINVTKSFTISKAEMGNKQKLKLEMINSLCKNAKRSTLQKGREREGLRQTRRQATRETDRRTLP